MGVKPPKRPPFLWTARRLDKLAGFVSSDGMPTVAVWRIAKAFPCSKNAVGKGLVILRGRPVAPFSFTPENIALLRGMAEDGQLTVSVARAALAFGCSPASLSAAMVRVGLVPLRRFHWTPGKLAILRNLCSRRGKLKIGAATAAAVLGCTRESLRQRLQLPLPHRYAGPATRARSAATKGWTSAHTAALRALAPDGVLTLTSSHAAQELGCPLSTLKRAMRRMDIRTTPKRRWTAADTRRLRGMVKCGVLTVPFPEAVEALGFPESMVHAQLWTRGIRRGDLRHRQWLTRLSIGAEMRPDGSTTEPVPDIARRHGVDAGTVWRALRDSYLARGGWGHRPAYRGEHDV